MRFSEELKKKLSDDHDKSDKIFNAALSIALTDRNVYRMAVYRFWKVYEMIEETMDELRGDCPELQQLYFPTLFRSEAFEDDVLYFYDGELPEDEISPGLQEYKQKIQADVAGDPVVLIGYLQTMQMAILAGGAILRPMIVRVLGLKKTFPLGVKVRFNFHNNNVMKGCQVMTTVHTPRKRGLEHNK
eukprot:sb/3471316/